MKKRKQTFNQLINEFQYHFDLRIVFDDFLTMCLCSVTQNPLIGKSHYEDLYLQTVAKYAKHDLRFHFPKMFAQLVLEMEERLTTGTGNDVLGEFYEIHLARKGAQQFFTPWHICVFMVKCVTSEQQAKEAPLRIMEPSCGSGRMLLAAGKELGPKHEYYGIDTDLTCVHMTALNLFLNGMFHSEVMCANALSPHDFRISYRLSFLPLGIFRIEQKENSPLWNMHNAAFGKVTRKEPEQAANVADWKAPQLKLF